MCSSDLLSATRESKTLRPALVALNDGSEQAQFVAQRILELRDENIDLNDIAVLYRAHYHALELQLELSRRGIPYRITSGIRFFEQAHIKDVTSFIRFVANPRDEVAFNRMNRADVSGVSACGDRDARIFQSFQIRQRDFVSLLDFIEGSFWIG